MSPPKLFRDCFQQPHAAMREGEMLEAVRTDVTHMPSTTRLRQIPPWIPPVAKTLHSSMAASTRGHSTLLVDDLWTTGTTSKQRTTTMHENIVLGVWGECSMTMSKELHTLLGRKCGSPGEPTQEPIAVGSHWNCTTDRPPTTRGRTQGLH